MTTNKIYQFFLSWSTFFGVVLKKLLPNPRSLRFVPVLFPRSFIVLCFTFRAVIHIESIFMNCVKCASMFIFLHVDLFFPYPVYEETIFAPLYCLCSLSNINWLCLCGSISGLFILFRWETCQFFHQYHSVLIIIALYLVLKLGCGSLLALFFYFNIVLTILSLLSFHIDFRMC